jgi:hypothetical protein
MRCDNLQVRDQVSAVLPDSGSAFLILSHFAQHQQTSLLAASSLRLRLEHARAQDGYNVPPPLSLHMRAVVRAQPNAYTWRGRGRGQEHDRIEGRLFTRLLRATRGKPGRRLHLPLQVPRHLRALAACSVERLPLLGGGAKDGVKEGAGDAGNAGSAGSVVYVDVDIGRRR